MSAGARKLHIILRVFAVFAAVLFLSGYHATARRMRALFQVLLLCHNIPLFTNVNDEIP
jgi:hypothetical protein